MDTIRWNCCDNFKNSIYLKRELNDFGAAVARAVKDALQGLEEDGKLIVIENLNLTVRYASGGGAVSCETYVSDKAKIVLDPNHLDNFLKEMERIKTDG